MKTPHAVPRTPPRQFTFLAKILAMAGLVALTALPAVYAQSGIWTNNASGNWDDAANWLNATVAEGTDAVADSEYPATERAKPQLIERLGARDVPVIYTRKAGAVTITIRPDDWTLRAPDGQMLYESGAVTAP